MRLRFAMLVLLVATSSCGVFNSLNSNTSIKPKETFILGKNEHGAFRTHVTNEGSTDLKVYQAPINGGTHSLIVVKPKEKAFLKTKKNTALVIENMGDVYGSVTLKVKGDLNLGMTYSD